MFWTKLKRAGRDISHLWQIWLALLLLISLMFLSPALANAGLLQLGKEAVQNQDYASAIQYFTQSIQQKDNPDAAYSNRCLTYLLMDSPHVAVKDCTTALQLNPASTRVQFYRGLAYYRLAQYNEAISDLTQYLQQFPQDARAYYNRGLAGFAAGSVEQALADYHQAVAYASTLAPLEMSNLYNDLGVAYLAQGELEAAIAALDQAVALTEDDPRAYFNRGCVCHRQGNYAAALQDFERALALDPTHADAYLSRSLVRQQMGHYDGAIADLEAAIEYFQQRGDAKGVHQAKLRLQQVVRPARVIG
ncbi:MAG: tetratricopeptide repeat protein [Cyanobacteria bacterium J06626_18]